MGMDDQMQAALKGVDIFKGLPDKSVAKIAKQMKTMHFADGSTIVEEDTGGELGRLYVVLEGTARAEIDGREVATYGHGDHFGEMSLLDGKPRSATVTATSDLTLAGLASWNFRPILSTEPSIAVHLVEVLASRLREANRRTT